MSPPNLSTYAPVSNVFEPLKPLRLELFRVDFKFAILHDLYHVLGDLLAIHEPLGFDQGLNDIPTS